MAGPVVAIMQPYFFPYLGYFQLLQAADKFVIYDDVQYVKRSWISRNRIIERSLPKWLTYAVLKAPQTQLINERFYRASPEDRSSAMNSVTAAYRQAPFFASAIPIIEEIFNSSETNVARFNANLLRTLQAALNIECEIIYSSSLNLDPSIRGQERVLAICKALGTTRYINPIGGMDLYEKAAFKSNGIDLAFLKSGLPQYRQFGGEFVPALSIIDIMMFNSAAQITTMLDDYALL